MLVIKCSNSNLVMWLQITCQDFSFAHIYVPIYICTWDKYWLGVNPLAATHGQLCQHWCVREFIDTADTYALMLWTLQLTKQALCCRCNYCIIFKMTAWKCKSALTHKSSYQLIHILYSRAYRLAHSDFSVVLKPLWFSVIRILVII